MPSLMEIFAGSDEVVRFEPVGPEDVAAAPDPGFAAVGVLIRDIAERY